MDCGVDSGMGCSVDGGCVSGLGRGEHRRAYLGGRVRRENGEPNSFSGLGGSLGHRGR